MDGVNAMMGGVSKGVLVMRFPKSMERREGHSFKSAELPIMRNTDAGTNP